MIDKESVIEGWPEIAALFQVSKQTMIKRKDELKAAGAIFYIMKGKPPRKVVCAFPSTLRRWISSKSAKGQLF